MPSLSRRWRWVWSCRISTAANCGVDDALAFHHALNEPCGSVSMSATGPKPNLSNVTEAAAQKLVLPEPPLSEVAVMVYTSRPPSLYNYIAKRVSKYIREHK